MTKRLFPLSLILVLPLLIGLALISVGQTLAGSADICAATCTYSTIQDAVTNAPEGSTLTIAAETFSETVEITRDITLIGAGSGATIIDAQTADSVIWVHNGVMVSISGVTIQNGDTTDPNGGGGLLNEDGTVTLTNSIVQNNLAYNGAGISNLGTMTLDNVTVRNNVADDLVGEISICNVGCSGGGIYNEGTMTLTNSTIHGNSSLFGAGLDNNAGTLNATSIEVYENTAENNEESAGGGIENVGTMTLTNSTVRNNTAIWGAGLVNDGTMLVSGSDFYENVAANSGGGMHNRFNLTVQTSNVYSSQAGSDGGGGMSSESGDVVVMQTAVYNNSATGSGGGIVHNVPAGSNSFTITNSTISGNSTSGSGGGVGNAGVANTTLSNVTFHNNSSNIVAGQSVYVAAGTVSAARTIFSITHSGTNCSGTITSQGYNLISGSGCNANGSTDLANTSALLGPLQNNGGSTLTHALLLGSPAIDSGGSGCPAVDQRGVARPFGSACDRGAYEYDEVVGFLYVPFLIRP